MKDTDHVEHLSAGFPDDLLSEDPLLPIFTSLTGGTQGVLFDDERQALDDTVGYRGATACKIAGITYRQLDYWARTELVEPTVRSAKGSGTQRLYSFRDILALKIVKRLLDAGISLRNIRTAVEFLAERGTTDLAQTTLISDGTTVYEATSDAEIIDLLHGGQGVFAIAVGHTLTDLAGTVHQFPAEDATPTAAAAVDELAQRRNAAVSEAV